MIVMIVEDQAQDIMGILEQCKVRDWEVKVCENFCHAAASLAEKDIYYELMLLDIILPCAVEFPVKLAQRYPDQLAGLYLLEAMRERRDGVEIFRHLKLSLDGRYVQTPVIVFSKIREVHAGAEDSFIEDSFAELDVKRFFGKGEYSFRVLMESMEECAKSIQHNGNGY